MLVILLAAGCAEPEGTDYRGGWRAIECEPAESESHGWYARLEVSGDPRPVSVLANAEGSDTWYVAYVSSWDPDEDFQTVDLLTAKPVAECLAWVAE
jgi:hypothetical protein